ncbi:putative lysophospholipase [Neospora caninum Liverpool]|uniref:Lysophospholipase, putative n=1 Tax=Neospora caninum (strain Liverpool) TaxID=572307 RepID=F0VD97_NEOCL|nr:putative lysophospholipase [Neospora caninum Liverpool]CBZ51612.1 putative lysophospholipase [Neospora caninum Liverpool]CEL65564.1 TPA: lysophospholipase, putative [Neospora caninum Liverpool]|eukprot:XP_003881645.1 putative lysophospholipase [Neospora caninum Liverpool]
MAPPSGVTSASPQSPAETDVAVCPSVICTSETKLEEWPHPRLPPFSIDYVELRYPQVAIFHNVKDKPVVRYTWPTTTGAARGAVVLLHDQGTHTMFEWLKHLPPLSKEEREQMEEDPDATETEKKEFMRMRKASHYEGSWVQKFNDAGLDVHAIDLQGHGLSKVVEGKNYELPCSFDEFAEDTCWLLEEVCRHSTLPIFIVGQGLGATIAARAVEMLARQGKLGKPHVPPQKSADAGVSDQFSTTGTSQNSQAGNEARGLQYATETQYCLHTGKGKKEVPVEHITVQARPIPIAGLVLLSPLLTLKEITPEEMHKGKKHANEGIMTRLARCFGSSSDSPHPLAGLLGFRMHQENPLMPDYNVWYKNDTMTIKGLTPQALYNQIRQGIDSAVDDARWLLTPVERDSAHTFSLKDWQEKHRRWMEMMRTKPPSVLASLIVDKNKDIPEVPDLAPWLKDEFEDQELSSRPWRLQERAAAQEAERNASRGPLASRLSERAKLAYYVNVLLVQSLADTTANPRGTAYFFKRIGGRIQASREILVQLGELPEEEYIGSCSSCRHPDVRQDDDSAKLTAVEFSTESDDSGWVEVVTNRPVTAGSPGQSQVSPPKGSSPAGSPSGQVQGSRGQEFVDDICRESVTSQNEESANQTDGYEAASNTEAQSEETETGDNEAVQERVKKLMEVNMRLDKDLQLKTTEEATEGMSRQGTFVRPSYLQRFDTEDLQRAKREAEAGFVGVEEVKWVKEVPARGVGPLACCGGSTGRVRRVDLVEAKVRLVDRIVMMEATDSVKALIDEIGERERLQKEAAKQKKEQSSWFFNCIAGGEPVEKPVPQPVFWEQKRLWRNVQGVVVDESGRRVPVEEVERLRTQKPEDYMRLFFRYGAATGNGNHARTAMWLVPDMYHSLCQEDKDGQLAAKLLDQWILPVLGDLEERELVWQKVNRSANGAKAAN